MTISTAETTAFDKKRTYEWLVISQSYMQHALITARILKEKIGEYGAVAEGSPRDFCLKKIYGDYPQSPEYLVFPIIFSFRHGIEIYLKAIAGIKNGQFTQNHNISVLLEVAKIADKKIKDITNKYGYAHLFLPDNKKLDKKNIFERYPQNTPYDGIEITTTVTEDKLNELISDTESVYRVIRKISLGLIA